MNRATIANQVESATGILADDQEPPSLIMIAGLEERGSVFEPEKHFSRALRELHISEPE